jgi:hypothetical protein
VADVLSRLSLTQPQEKEEKKLAGSMRPPSRTALIQEKLTGKVLPVVNYGYATNRAWSQRGSRFVEAGFENRRLLQ